MVPQLAHDNHLFCSQSLVAALKNWRDIQALGKHALSSLALIQHQRGSSGYLSQEVGAGLALRQLLWQAIEELKPSVTAPEVISKEWFCHLILKKRYIEMHKPTYIMSTLLLPERTYYHYHHRALHRLGNILQEWELLFISGISIPGGNSEQKSQPLFTSSKLHNGIGIPNGNYEQKEVV